jgi:hypothetical protein
VKVICGTFILIEAYDQVIAGIVLTSPSQSTATRGRAVELSAVMVLPG